MVFNKSKLLVVIIALVAIVSIGIYYAVNNTTAAEGSSQPEVQALPVSINVIQSEKVNLWKKFSGHIVAIDESDIRPQVSGRIMEILFKDGQYVEKGDTLLIIDPRPYEAVLAQAEAELASAQTQANLAEKEYIRAKSLIGMDAISKSLFDQRSNARVGAGAAVKAARAKVAAAKLDLDYAYVKAPISGKVSRAEVTVGNLVQSGPNAPLLTSIVSDGDVYVDFEVDEKTYINSIQANAVESKNKIPVRLDFGGDVHAFQGYVSSFDNKIDPASGTIRARAILPNKNNMLLPGMSVSVEMGELNNNSVILVSELALGTDQDRKFVYVVGDDNIAKYREVKIGQSIDGQRVVLSGLKPDDKVISKGISRIRPDTLVEATEELQEEKLPLPDDASLDAETEL
ncbi:MAG: efflux transporter periplasmic adaptor subunit [Alphaproteobacteria bacterium]|nr:efflux transporter periplasmic adaptor subunit [Alphaproteobacteria bacterium]